jgi:hypothetical protein
MDVHLKNEIVLAKEYTRATCNRSIQILQHDAKNKQAVVDTLTTMKPYLSKHRLQEYDF